MKEEQEPETRFYEFHSAMIGKRVQCKESRKIMNSIEIYSALMRQQRDRHARAMLELMAILDGDHPAYRAVAPPVEPAPVVPSGKWRF